jgi:hypothetical protein
MEEVSFVSSKRPEIDIRIVYEQLNALDIILENGIMKSGISLLAFKVYVVGVSHLLQNVFYVVVYPLETGKH